MYRWANDTKEQIVMCVLEVQGISDGVDDVLMARVLKRRGWYLVPDDSYPSLQAYIDASYAALAADVRASPPRPPTASVAALSSRPSAPPPPRRSAPSPRARPRSGRAPALQA
jgi:hypothetical protein